MVPRTVEELTPLVADLKKEVARALKQHGERSPEHRAATANLGMVQRRLDAAVAKEERREELDKLSPKEVVDRLYGR